MVNKELEHVLSNISERKGNQTLKFGQVKEYNEKNEVFLPKLCRKQGRDISARPFFVP